MIDVSVVRGDNALLGFVEIASCGLDPAYGGAEEANDVKVKIAVCRALGEPVEVSLRKDVLRRSALDLLGS